MGTNVSALLGHACLNTTLHIYSYASEGHKSLIAQKFDEAMSP